MRHISKACRMEYMFLLLMFTGYHAFEGKKCVKEDGTAQTCMPRAQDIAFGRKIEANNTCGINGPQEYCVLGLNTFDNNKSCRICDSRDAVNRHTTDLLTDSEQRITPTQWQSETLFENRYPVYLALNFQKKFEVTYVKLIFGSPRPRAFAIYKKSSYDQKEAWLPYQFFAQDCEEVYNLPKQKKMKSKDQIRAFCSESKSSIVPTSRVSVTFSTIENQPGVWNFDNNDGLQEWVTVTALRFNLDQLNTFGDEIYGDEKVLKSYYFAISSVVVKGRCKCNGHAAACSSTKGETLCLCEHNTAGKDCEKCLPLFNDQPWKRGSKLSASPCQECNCNSLAEECEFDEKLWLESNHTTGGRCLNCKNNTDGPHCERCKDYYFRTSTANVCEPCDCNPVGSISLSCNNEGKCQCRIGVTGEKCDKCEDGLVGSPSTGCRKDT